MSIKQNVDFDVKFTFQVDGNGGKSPRISRQFNANVVHQAVHQSARLD